MSNTNMQVSQIQRNLTILKATLLLREKLGVKSSSKEEVIRMGQEYTDSQLSLWIDLLHEDIQKSAETREKEAKERIQSEMERDFPQDYKSYETVAVCCTNRDYGPSNPWDAPGMSVRDFI